MKIQPISALGAVMVNLDIESVQVNVAEKRAICNVVFSADDGTRLPRQVSVKGDEYAGWGSDDNYIVDLLLAKFGVTRAPEPEKVAVPV